MQPVCPCTAVATVAWRLRATVLSSVQLPSVKWTGGRSALLRRIDPLTAQWALSACGDCADGNSNRTATARQRQRQRHGNGTATARQRAARRVLRLRLRKRHLDRLSTTVTVAQPHSAASIAVLQHSAFSCSALRTDSRGSVTRRACAHARLASLCVRKACTRTTRSGADLHARTRTYCEGCSAHACTDAW